MEKNLNNKEVFTGERFIPELFTEKDEIYRAHVNRYLFAQQLLNSEKKDLVLDISSGEGYGTALLGEVAKKVIGVDIDEQAVSFSNKKYGNNVVSFLQGNAEDSLFSDDEFEAVISFETLEHLTKKGQEKFLNNVQKTLKKNGLFIISTPDKDIYGSGDNHFHEHELSKKEFISLLSKYFSVKEIYGQNILERKNVFMRTVRGFLDIIIQSHVWKKMKQFIPHSIKYYFDQKTNKYNTIEVMEKDNYFTVEKIKDSNSAKYIILVCKNIFK